MQKFQIDSVDIKILNELQRDASLTNVELAARVHLSPSPCLARVRSLEKHGFIRRRVGLVDPAKLGLTVNLFIQVSLERQSRQTLDTFEQAIAAIPQVMECYLMAGEADYLIRVVAAGIPELERLIADVLTHIPGVSNIKSSFALKQVKYDTALPLPELS